MMLEWVRVRRAAKRAGLLVGRYDDQYVVCDSFGNEAVGFLSAADIIAIGRDSGGQLVEF